MFGVRNACPYFHLSSAMVKVFQLKVKGFFFWPMAKDGNSGFSVVRWGEGLVRELET